MSESCPTTAGSTATITLPPVACARWCYDGTGHVDAWHPDDQYCMGVMDSVELTAMPLTGADDARARDWIGAHLLRRSKSIATTVELLHDDREVARLTPSEAIALGRLLQRMGEVAMESVR